MCPFFLKLFLIFNNLLTLIFFLIVHSTNFSPDIPPTITDPFSPMIEKEPSKFFGLTAFVASIRPSFLIFLCSNTQIAVSSTSFLIFAFVVFLKKLYLAYQKAIDTSL